LVGTQNIRNNQSRVGGLDYITSDSTIVEAVDNQPWSGEANVHVSIVNWVKTRDAHLVPVQKTLWSTTSNRDTKSRSRTEFLLTQCSEINSALSCKEDVSGKVPLHCNQKPKRCFQGKIPGYDGFLVTEDNLALVRDEPIGVAVPYLTGRELLGEWRLSRWAIDFRDMPMHQAARFEKAFLHCREVVLPEVEKKYRDAIDSKSDMAAARKEHLDRWWQFWNRRDELNAALKGMERYVGCSRVTRRPVMVFLSTRICPSDLVQVFAFDDDYSFGILQSDLHFEWFRTSSRLKVESDLRYSVRDVFETFPWPQSPAQSHVLTVADAARKVRNVRAQVLSGMSGGLRSAYRLVEIPGNNILKTAHAELDDAVRACYRFARGHDYLKSLLALNARVAARIVRGEDVTAPGIPKNMAREPLVSYDCLG
jgi:hypothetical protein